MSDRTIHRGLEGITVAETTLSSVDGETGELIVGGYPIEDLAPMASYEESVYLLLEGRLPTAAELARFETELTAHREISDEVRAVLRRAAAEEQPAMDALRMGVAAATLGAGGTDEVDGTDKVDGTDETVNTGDVEPREAALRVISIVPTIVAAYWRYRTGNDPLDPRPDLGHAANYLYMLTGEEPAADAVAAMDSYLVTVIDHGLNASTFTARSVVSTGSDLVSAATAAVGSLKGPLHGGAPGPVLDMLQAVHEEGDPEGYVEDTLDAGERLMGFGHRVYEVRDPRAAVLSEAAAKLYDDDAFFETVQEFEREAVDRLAAHKPDRSLETNVEYYTAALLHRIGVPQPLFTATFAISRVGGWMAHGLEQRDDNRIIRPVGRYVGEAGKTWTPVDQR